MNASAHNIRLVVIGASAGGVIALQSIASSLPSNFPLPVLIVLHVPRDRPNGVSELLARGCKLPVFEAEDKLRFSGGSVILAPPDYHMLVESRNELALSVDEPVLFSRPSIDVMFESAAHVYGKEVLAILLTGASRDGTAGIAAVRAAGGLAWIQDPADAQVPLMPVSALEHSGADAVLTVAEICARLAAELL